MKPLVSVVIPVFNREKLVVRTLDSVLAQTYRPLELIVVDNASTDSSLPIIGSWIEGKRGKEENIRFEILQQPEKGACATRQKGLENVTGEYVIFFDSDDVMKPYLLENAMERVEASPKTDIVCWPCCIHQLDGSLRIPPFMPDNLLDGHLIHNIFRPQGTLFRTDFLKKIGGWNKSLPVWNDFELGLRIILNNPVVKSVDKVLADIYAQESSITGKDFSHKQGLWENTLDTLRKVNNKSDFPRKKRIDDLLTYREIILAAHYSREGNKIGASLLKNKALKDKKKLQKFLLQFSYHYTRFGGRGVWRLINKFY